jgi:hypothetical protein
MLVGRGVDGSVSNARLRNIPADILQRSSFLSGNLISEHFLVVLL